MQIQFGEIGTEDIGRATDTEDIGRTTDTEEE